MARILFQYCTSLSNFHTFRIVNVYEILPSSAQYAELKKKNILPQVRTYGRLPFISVSKSHIKQLVIHLREIFISTMSSAILNKDSCHWIKYLPR